MPTAAETPTNAVRLDPQDPLPESNWIPRRWFAFLGGAALLILFGYAIKNHEPGFAWPLAVVVSLLVICYLIAPSAEQFGKIVQTAAALRAGVAFHSSTTASAGDASATSTAAAVPPPVPPAEPDPNK